MRSRHEVPSIWSAALTGVASGIASFAAYYALDASGMRSLVFVAVGISYGLGACYLLGRHVHKRRALSFTVVLALSVAAYYVSQLQGPLVRRWIPWTGFELEMEFAGAGALGAWVTYLGFMVALSAARSVVHQLIFSLVGMVSGMLLVFVLVLTRFAASYVQALGSISDRTDVLLSLLLIFVIWQSMTLASLPLILGKRIRQTSLREFGPTCAVCGYNLCGNVSGVCPECGTPRSVDPSPSG